MNRENVIFSQMTIFRAFASRRLGVNIVRGYDFEKRRGAGGSSPSGTIKKKEKKQTFLLSGCEAHTL